MANELNFASFLLAECFMKTDYKCGSAKLQKLILIANLKKLLDTNYKISLCDVNYSVNLCGFGIKSIAEFFIPDLWGSKSKNEPIQRDELKDNNLVLNEIYNVGYSNVSDEDRNLLTDVFLKFGAYEATDIGQIMNQMNLHSIEKEEINNEDLINYLIKNLDDDNNKHNEIAEYLKNSSKKSYD